MSRVTRTGTRRTSTEDSLCARHVPSASHTTTSAIASRPLAPLTQTLQPTPRLVSDSDSAPLGPFSASGLKQASNSTLPSGVSSLPVDPAQAAPADLADFTYPTHPCPAPLQHPSPGTWPLFPLPGSLFTQISVTSLHASSKSIIKPSLHIPSSQGPAAGSFLAPEFTCHYHTGVRTSPTLDSRPRGSRQLVSCSLMCLQPL